MPDNSSTTTTNDDASGYSASNSALPPISSDPSTSPVSSTPPNPQSQDSYSASSVTPTPVPTDPPTDLPTDTPNNNVRLSGQTPDIYVEVAKHISEAKNVLIALSSDPSVDEMAAAIGLSLYLDRLGKRATAIYSGTTPNALEFLKPEKTFEPTADTLQDFVIALSKDKADHLRYKLDGSYVKIYITPYRSRISEDDLDFSYGDYNVDLVLALDISNGIDLDSALREHGRIMHDAVIINITTGKPGKFGEIEWSDKKASSISEMIARLLYSVNSEVKVGKEEATAFLTGIVAATNRFSNASTTPETMEVSSLLMSSGANQQLVSKNITPDVDNEIIDPNATRPTLLKEASADSDDIGSDAAKGGNPSGRRSSANQELDIDHSEELDDQDEDSSINADDNNTPNDNGSDNSNDGDNVLFDDLKAAEETLSHTGTETTPETAEQPLEINSEEVETPAMAESELRDQPVEEEDETRNINKDDDESPVETAKIKSTDDNTDDTLKLPEIPQIDFDAQPSSSQPQSVPIDSLPKVTPPEQNTDSTSSNQQFSNPITANIPKVPTQPEVNGIPDINYMPMPDDSVLPPPPAPLAPSFDSAVPPVKPVDTVATPTELTNPIAPPKEPLSSAIPPVMPAPQTTASPEPAAPPTSAETLATPTSLGSQPAMQDQVYVPQAADPSAFKIPGLPN